MDQRPRFLASRSTETPTVKSPSKPISHANVNQVTVQHFSGWKPARHARVCSHCATLSPCLEDLKPTSCARSPRTGEICYQGQAMLDVFYPLYRALLTPINKSASPCTASLLSHNINHGVLRTEFSKADQIINERVQCNTECIEV